MNYEYLKEKMNIVESRMKYWEIFADAVKNVQNWEHKSYFGLAFHSMARKANNAKLGLNDWELCGPVKRKMIRSQVMLAYTGIPDLHDEDAVHIRVLATNINFVNSYPYQLAFGVREGGESHEAYTLEEVDVETRKADLGHIHEFYSSLTGLRRVRYNDGSIGGYTDANTPVAGLTIDKGAVVLNCEINIHPTSNIKVGKGVVIADSVLSAKEDSQLTLRQALSTEDGGNPLYVKDSTLEVIAGNKSVITANGHVNNSVISTSNILSENFTVLNAQIVRTKIETLLLGTDTAINLAYIVDSRITDSEVKSVSESHDVFISNSIIEKSNIIADGEDGDNIIENAYLSVVNTKCDIRVWYDNDVPVRVAIVYDIENGEYIICFQSKDDSGAMRYNDYADAIDFIADDIRYVVDRALEAFREDMNQRITQA